MTETTPVDPAERRIHYASAMARRDGDTWPTAYESDEADYLRRADAAIAVADAEQAEMRTANERMRHELEVMYGGAFDTLPAATVPAPAPTDRLPSPDSQAVLRWAADRIDELPWDGECGAGRDDAAEFLRRLADAASGPGRADGETQQDETQAEPGTCGHRSSEGHPCTQPPGHLGYHRNSRHHGNEWTSWVGDTPATSTDTEECCGAEPPKGWPGDCWCTLPPKHPGDHQCTPCSNRHDAPGWTEQPAAVSQPDEEPTS